MQTPSKEQVLAAVDGAFKEAQSKLPKRAPQAVRQAMEKTHGLVTAAVGALYEAPARPEAPTSPAA